MELMFWHIGWLGCRVVEVAVHREVVIACFAAESLCLLCPDDQYSISSKRFWFDNWCFHGRIRTANCSTWLCLLVYGESLNMLLF